MLNGTGPLNVISGLFAALQQWEGHEGLQVHVHPGLQHECPAVSV